MREIREKEREENGEDLEGGERDKGGETERGKEKGGCERPRRERSLVRRRESEERGKGGGREGEERTWSRGCQAGLHEALTCPKGSRWLLVSLSFWKETSCRIQCAPVAGESGCTYRRPGMAGSALPVTDLDQGEANRPALAPRGAGSPCTGPGLPRDARGASRPLAASQPSAGSGSLDVRKSLGKLLDT